LLKEHGVPATFFVVGRLAERYPDLVRRMAAEGHVVGNHTFYHTTPSLTSTRQLVDETRRTRDVLAGLLGKVPTLFRPPHGKVTAAKLWGLWRAGQTVVLWNVDPKDYARQFPDEILTWFRKRPLRGGDLVLMHDRLPHAVAVLPSLIANAREQGLTFSTPDQWAK
jgi:peptidoglycan/xylan/chitin deacetylase (PgdA/CDA1 family)